MNKLTPRTKYLVKSVDQLLEIKKACEEQGGRFEVSENRYDEVGIVYVKGSIVAWEVAWDREGYDSRPDYTLLEWGSENPVNPFENTYLFTGNLSQKEINRIAVKYLEALGADPEGGDYNFWVRDGGVMNDWKYLYKSLDESQTEISDNFSNVSHLREITEQDLDNYLSNNSNNPLDEEECIKYLKGLGYRVIKENFKGSVMTPCEELGYKVGDKFEVVGEKANHSVGSVLELVDDDGTHLPYFKVLSGEKKGIYQEGFEILISIKKISAGLPEYPTFDFKINLSNMTGAEKKVAKEWLVEVAKSRGKIFNPNQFTDDQLGILTSCSYVQNIEGKWDCNDEVKSLPELFLTFSAPTITSWEAAEASPKKTEKECQRLLQLESLVDKLKSQLEEAQKQLEDINSK